MSPRIDCLTMLTISGRSTAHAKGPRHSFAVVPIFACAVGALAASTAAGDLINIKADGSGDYPTIQAAINAAATGDEIVLEGGQGAYTGPGNKEIDFSGKAITVRSADPSSSAVVAATVIDCQFDGRAFIFENSETREAILDGLTIINGRRQDVFGRGGGILIANSSPTIRRCVIAHCDVNWLGAGVRATSSDALLEDCVIENNLCDGGAGGVSWDGGNPELRGCVIRNNRASSAGGGTFSSLDSATMINCLVEGNVATNYVGGVGFAGDNFPGAQIAIWNCSIVNNHATMQAGGLSFYYHQDTTIRNCVVWGNTAPLAPQIRVSDNPHPTNPVTVRVEFSDVQGGAADVLVGVRNTLIWTASNIDADPEFTPGPAGCFYLSQTAAGQLGDSPCVDEGAGTAAAYGLDASTTRSDEVTDSGATDMGYHYAVTGQPLLMGDHDRNGHIELADFAAMQNCVTGDGVTDVSPCCRIFDFEPDADVDLADYADFAALLIP